MHTPARSLRNAVLAAALAAAGLGGAPAAARAQAAPSTDPRWQAWLGCWEQAPQANARRSGASTHALLVCIVPAAGSTGVDVATVADTQVVARERLEATSARRPVTRDNCSGWESADWSALGERLYLHSELTCQGNLVRRSSGLMAFSPEGEWLDVRAAVAGTRVGVRVLRYKPAPLPATLPAGLASALHERGALEPPLTTASADLTIADVAEASHALEEGVVAAWLAEVDQDFAMDAHKLLAAKHAGVPGGITDLMVALSYPRVFAVNPASRQVDFREPAYTTGATYAYGPDYGWGGSYYSPWGWDTWWPYGYSPYSPFWSPYGYGYGAWYGGYYGGWYYNGGGVIISPGGGGNYVDVGAHGQVVKGRGYVSGGSLSSTGREAQARGQSPSGRESQGQGRRESGSSAGSSSGSSSGGRSQPSSGGSSSGSSGRTAKPRSPGR